MFFGYEKSFLKNAFILHYAITHGSIGEIINGWLMDGCDGLTRLSINQAE